jgi:hypothetical protein
LANGDEAGFKALTDRLVAGRREDSSIEAAVSSAETPVAASSPSAPEASTPDAPAEDKPVNPKIKRWEPKS